MSKNTNNSKSRIYELRTSLRIKQVEMAEEIGVSQQTISRIEMMPQKAPVDLLISIANFLKFLLTIYWKTPI